MKRTLTLLGAAAAALSYFALSAVPAFGDSAGEVTATVTVAAPCITLDNTATSYGSRPFSTAGNVVIQQAAPHVTYTNCSPQSEQIFVRGSGGTGTNATWSLIPENESVCPGPDRFKQAVSALPGGPGVWLSTSDQLLTSTAANAAQGTDSVVHMPCTGSSGAGQLMTTVITYTATF